MFEIGYHASHEQFNPAELLGYVKLAEKAGFDCAMCSDHFHPWSREQGQSGFTWSWLGSALEATKLSFGTVNAPGQRYHPAIIAQAAATLCQMYPGRFWLSVGSGENLNEHITGDPWPEKDTLNARLKECVSIMRSLWGGETVNHEGLIKVRDARLFTLPPEPPLIVGAAITEATAGWIGSFTDALITIYKPLDEIKRVVDAFQHGAGKGKSMYIQVQLSCAESDDKAEDAAYEQWRTNVIDSDLLANLSMPEDFEKAAKSLTPADLHKGMIISSSPERFIEEINAIAGLGFERIYLHNVTRDQNYFIEQFSRHVLPKLRG